MLRGLDFVGLHRFAHDQLRQALAAGLLGFVVALLIVFFQFFLVHAQEAVELQHRTGGGVRTDVVGPMPVKSEIIRPVDGSVLGIGANRLFGMAWAGEHAVAAVEVSVDEALSWRRAELHGPTAKFSWTPWELLWKAAKPGEYRILARAVSENGEVQPMRHDMDRGGYLINFSRPISVHVDPQRVSHDHLGDAHALARICIRETNSGR